MAIGTTWASDSWDATSWEDGSWGDAAVEEEAPYQGKYRAEWAGALRDVGASVGFTSEHAGALRDVGDAGR